MPLQIYEEAKPRLTIPLKGKQPPPCDKPPASLSGDRRYGPVTTLPWPGASRLQEAEPLGSLRKGEGAQQPPEGVPSPRPPCQTAGL